MPATNESTKATATTHLRIPLQPRPFVLGKKKATFFFSFFSHVQAVTFHKCHAQTKMKAKYSLLKNPAGCFYKKMPNRQKKKSLITPSPPRVRLVCVRLGPPPQALDSWSLTKPTPFQLLPPSPRFLHRIRQYISRIRTWASGGHRPKKKTFRRQCLRCVFKTHGDLQKLERCKKDRVKCLI